MDRNITPNRIFTGRQIVSLFLPYGLYYTKVSSIYDKSIEEVMNYTEEEKIVVFKNGYMISGVLDNETVGCNNNNSLFRACIECVGAKKTLKIIHALSTLFMRYLCDTDFTLTLKDISLSTDAQNFISGHIRNKEEYIKQQSERFYAGEIVANYDETPYKTLRKNVFSFLKTADEYFRDTVNGITDFKKNNLIRCGLSVNGSVKKVLSKMGNPLGPPISKGEPINYGLFARASRHFQTLILGMQECFIEGNYTVGIALLSMLIALEIAIITLTQRINGTAGAGTIRHELMNTLSVYHLNNHGHVVYGDYMSTMYHSSLCYGYDGLSVNKIMSSDVFGKFIKMPIEKLYSAYFQLNKASEPLRNYSENSWDMFKQLVSDTISIILMLSRGGLIDSGHNMKISVPFSIEYRVDLDAEFVLENAEDNFKLAAECIKNINYIYVNELNHVKDDFIVKCKLKMTVMYLLFCFSPIMLGKIPKDVMKVLSEDFYLKYRDSIAPAGLCVGMLAGATQSKTLVQNSLDAPKKQADNTMLEEEKTHNRIIFPRNTASGAYVYFAPITEEYYNTDVPTLIVEDKLSNYIDKIQITNEHLVGFDYDQITRKNINNSIIIDTYIVITLLKSQLVKKNVKLADITEKIEDYNDGMIVVEKKNVGMAVSNVAHKSVIVLFFTKEAASDLFGEVSNDMIRVAITDLTDSIIIKGFPHILSAAVIYNTAWIENKAGEFETKVMPYAKIVADNIYGVLNLKCIDHRYLCSENPNISLKMSGLNSARLSTMLMLMKITKTNISHVMQTIDVLFYRGYAIACKTSGISKRLVNSTLISAVGADPKGKIIAAAKSGSRVDISDIMSRLLMGQSLEIRTSYCKTYLNDVSGGEDDLDLD